MCTGLEIAAIASAAATGGAGLSYAGQRAASQAAYDQQVQEVANQNAAFWSRAAAQRAQTEGTFNVQEAGLSAERQAANTLQNQQTAARDAWNQQVQQINQRQQDIAQQGQTASAQLVAQTTAQQQQAAQDAARAQRLDVATTAAAPNITVASPMPTETTSAGDIAGRQAYARATAGATQAVRDYASRAADVASYNQPLTEMGLAIEGNRTGIMPTEVAENLLRSGVSTRLLPAGTAFDVAQRTFGATKEAIGSQVQSGLDLANLAYRNATGIADLTQADKDTMAANKAAIDAANAGATTAMGNIISNIGALGARAVGYYGTKAAAPTTVNAPVTDSLYDPKTGQYFGRQNI